MSLPRAVAGLAAIAALAVPGAASAAPNPADQPPLGGEPIPPLVHEAPGQPAPAGFDLTPADALAIANRTEAARDEGAGLDAVVGTRGEDSWQVSYFDSGRVERVRVVVEDPSGRVLETLTGHQVDTPLARGYPGAVAGIANRIYVWLPLCLLFLAPFFDPRRPFRLLHLDLLVMLAFGVSQIFFNRGEIGLSVPLVYPVLAYLFVRMLAAGFRRDGERERRDRLVPWAPGWLLVAAIAALVVFRVGVSVSEDNVIDVGYAGVIGADRVAHGEDIYDADSGAPTQVRGDVYGPVNYLAYVPFEAALPWSGHWDICRRRARRRSHSTCSPRCCSSCSVGGCGRGRRAETRGWRSASPGSPIPSRSSRSTRASTTRWSRCSWWRPCSRSPRPPAAGP